MLSCATSQDHDDEEADAMPAYLIQVAYKDAAAGTMIANPQPREDVMERAVASVGGKVIAFFFAFGGYDVIAIAEFDGNESAAAFALASAAGGAIAKFHTTALLTSGEAVAAMRKAQ